MNWVRHLVWLAAAAGWGQTPGSVPVGAILAWYGDPAALPPEWRLCDGALVSDPESPLTGQRVPDLRGRFLRGAACCGPGEGAGETGGQDEAPAHSHPFSAATNNVWFGPESVAGWRGAETLPEGPPRGRPKAVAALTVPREASGRGPWPSHGHMGGSASFSGATANAGGHDNRPRFVSLHFIIRIK
jgi:hypothetical protein